MVTKRLFLLMLLLCVGCQQAAVSEEKEPLEANSNVAEAELDKQLNINKVTLLEGTNKQRRIDAAVLMLFSENPLARTILIEALKDVDNSGAQAAVCMALSLSVAGEKPVENKNEFFEPLLEMLKTSDAEQAKLAAEALLIYDYGQISGSLEKIINDSELAIEGRLNAVYALKVQPDRAAILKLLDLLESEDKQIAETADKTLESLLGISVGNDIELRRQIRREISQKSREQFLRDWQVRQRYQEQLSESEGERDWWENECLLAWDQMYADKDDAAKGTFLAEHLVSSRAAVKLWALEKVSQWRKGTSKPPIELGPVLVGLISDENRDVRLSTAKLLPFMGELNSAEKVLGQVDIEKDDEVKMELFVALGDACYYASLPDSKTSIPAAVKQRALEMAEEYLSQTNPEKAISGAKVMKKLLEQDGLPASDVDKYLSQFVERYNQNENNTASVRVELLNAMAGLCAQSVYKNRSAKLFEPLFEGALRSETELIRATAVDGLIYIDTTMALNKLRKESVNDSSKTIRERVIQLAGEVGGQEDLDWLAEKIPSGEGEFAWQAMIKIFASSDASVLEHWMTGFDAQREKYQLSLEQEIAFLVIAERKAGGDQKTEMLEKVLDKSAGLYNKRGDFEQAARSLGSLLKIVSARRRDEIKVRLLDAHIRNLNVKAAKELVANTLLERDLAPDDPIVSLIEGHLSRPPSDADAVGLLQELATINISERPKWLQQIKSWQQSFRKAQKAQENITAEDAEPAEKK